MSQYSLVIGIIGSILQVVLIWRAWKGALFSRFPLFYSYLVYLLLGSVTLSLIYRLRASYYPTFFWQFFLIALVVEFGVLIEISNHMFSSYPAIRRLGRFLAGCICGVFSFYIVLAFTHPLSRRAATLDLFKRVSITKAAIIVVLLAMARYYRLPVGKNVAGLMLGFSVYLGINIANFALEERLAPAVYDSIFAVVGPLSSIVCLIIWTVKLWRYEPVLIEAAQHAGASYEASEPVIYKIDRLNQTLTRVLRR